MSKPPRRDYGAKPISKRQVKFLDQLYRRPAQKPTESSEVPVKPWEELFSEES